MNDLILEFINECCELKDIDDQLIAEYTSDKLRNFIFDSDMESCHIAELCSKIQNCNIEYEFEGFIYNSIEFKELI